MKSFDQLMEVARTLNAPGGCPWDVKQTFKSLKKYILEEAHELVEAIDNDDNDHILEELGDLFYVVIFYAMVAEREKRFKMEEIIDHEREKLIRRHPHVFGEEKVSDAEEVLAVWEKVKAEEKKQRKSLLDGIPKTLDLVMRAQKVLEKVKFHDLDHFLEPAGDEMGEGHIGKKLIEMVYIGASHGIDVASALRNELRVIEKKFRTFEKKP